MPRKGRKKKYQREKLKKKAKRFATQNVKFVDSLVPRENQTNLAADPVNFFKQVLTRLLENPESKFLLRFNPKFPFNRYCVVSLITSYIRNQTRIVRCDRLILSLEIQPMDKNTNFLSLFSSTDSISNPDVPMDPSLLLIATNPLPREAIWCLELQPYFNALAKFYNLTLNYSYRPLKIDSYSPIILNPQIAITFLSTGKESLWSFSESVEKLAYRYSKIVVVFINNASPGGSYREKERFFTFSKWFKVSHMQKDRVEFFELQFQQSLLGIQKKETFLKVAGQNLKETICKLQYMQLLCAPLIREHKCGTFIVPQDYRATTYNKNAYFSDYPISFSAFLPFFSMYLGGRIKLSFQGIKVERARKVEKLLDIDWFKFNSSCYMNWNYFSFFQRKYFMNPLLNMCGICWKCKIDIKMIEEDEHLSKVLKL